MRIGFTGTRRGMTTQQREALRTILSAEEPGVFIHGDCIGADAQAHAIAKELGWSIEIFPCNIETARAHCEGDVVHEPRPPLDRDWDIVNSCEVLLGAPNEPIEVQRSGTWATVRRARRVDRPRALLWPAGGWIWEDHHEVP